MTKETVLKRIEKLADYFKYALITGDKHAKSELEAIRESVEALQTTEDAEIASSPEEGIPTLSSLPITKRQLIALALIPLCENLVDYSPSQKILKAYDLADEFLKLDEPIVWHKHPMMPKNTKLDKWSTNSK